MARSTKRSVALIALVFVAAFAVWAGYQYLRNAESELEAGFELIPVYRANGLIHPCTEGSSLLAEGRVVESEELVRYLPDRAIITPNEAEAVLTDRVALGPISNNMILTFDQWGREGDVVCSPRP